MTHTGWRKPTPGLAKAEQHAQVGERIGVPKTQAIVAVKKIAAAIGLKPSDMLLLDTLAAVTQPQDWGEGRRPIVWPSNARLEQQTGFSLPALKRHLRRLAEVGVVSFKDSPNGKRWGTRDTEGNIVEAYGIDLAPLAARAAEFEALHAHIMEEQALCRSLRDKITVTRRIIRAKIEKALETRLKGPWRELMDEFAEMLESLPGRSASAEKLLNLVDWFNEMKDRVEAAFKDAFEWPSESDAAYVDKGGKVSVDLASFSSKMNPTRVNNEPHI